MPVFIRRRLLQATAGSLLLPFYSPSVFGQPSRTLSVQRRSPEQQVRADADLNSTTRYALLIGNGDYASVPKLRNPANDARAIGEQLRGAGFQVDLRQNLTREAMLEAITTYAARIAATKSVGLFYFAGHGVQLAWRNFLIPVDAAIGKLEDIPQKCVDVGTLVSGITKAANPMNVVILDACRDNPFGNDKRVEQKGLSQLDAPPGTLLAFATSPGNTASDGDGANGLYTENLLRELQVPEAKIEDVFKRVRLGVRRRSNGQQIPWESTSLEEDFYFLPPKQFKPVTESEETRLFETQLALWEKIKNSGDLPVLEDFLRRYPSGHFSELAQLQLDRVLAAQGEKKIKIEASPTPFSQGTAAADTAYKVGDTYTYVLSDPFTKVVRRRVTETVTEITNSEVKYSSGRITDLLGNSIRTPEGRRSTPIQQFPTEYQVGKKWKTRSRIQDTQGRPGESTEDHRVVAREKIIVPAGAFDVFRVEGVGTWSTTSGSGSSSSTNWIVPNLVRQPVARESFIRRDDGRWLLFNRFELVSFKQS